MSKIYLDHAATTPVSESVFNAMKPYFAEVFGNANSQHSFGRDAARAVDKARKQTADALGCQANEIYFTSSGTEANNWAVRGAALSWQRKGEHVITSSVEHPSVKKNFEWLENNGFEVTRLPVNEFGVVSAEDVKKAIRTDTTLISVMMANNEMGAIQPSAQIGKIAKENKIIYHVDAVQAVGSLHVDITELNADLLTVSAHKFYGPKGVGALFCRKGLKIDKLILGGEQERGMRGGTTPTHLAAGMGQAIEEAVLNREKYVKHCTKLRDYFTKKVLSEIPFTKLNGHLTDRMPNNTNISFEFIEGESILIGLDLEGIAVSSGSACSSGSLAPSYVLEAMKVPAELMHGSIRFTFGADNSKKEIDFTVEKLKKIVDRLRAMSPLFKLNEGEVKNV